jgi:hypothetical protein
MRPRRTPGVQVGIGKLLGYRVGWIAVVIDQRYAVVRRGPAAAQLDGYVGWGGVGRYPESSSAGC